MRVAASAVLLAALAVLQAQAIGDPQRPSRAAAASAGKWVGVVEVSYSRRFKYPSGAEEHTEGLLAITSRLGAATATGKRTLRNSYPDSSGCRTVRREDGSATGKRVGTPSVTFAGGRHLVGYENPLVSVRIVEERDCAVGAPRRQSMSVLPVYIPIEGRGGSRTRVSGAKRELRSECVSTVECVEIRRAVWDLHLLTGEEGTGGGGTGGTGDGKPGGTDGGGPGGGPAPGEGCERRVRAGTSGDDRLIGGPAAELFLALDGDDAVRARGGRDCVWGGPGEDVLLGGAGEDVVGGDGGSDEVRSGGAGDRVLVRDGERDRVRCGRGIDEAVADPLDVLAGCERVRRP